MGCSLTLLASVSNFASAEFHQGRDTSENAGLSDGSEAANCRAWAVRPSVCRSLAAARPPAWGCLEPVRQRSTWVSGLVWTAGEGRPGALRRCETGAHAGQQALARRYICATSSHADLELADVLTQSRSANFPRDTLQQQRSAAVSEATRFCCATGRAI